MAVLDFLTGLFIIAAIGSLTEAKSRIVGGTLAEKGQFPWVVSMQLRNSVGGHFCGGSIIGKRHVLTAAHCVQEPINSSLVQIQYGVVDNKEPGNIILVKKITAHPNFTRTGVIGNDIAVVELVSDMKLDGVNSRAVKLPHFPLIITNYTTGQLCGWGYRSTEEPKVQQYLLWTDLPIWNQETCQELLGSSYSVVDDICAGSLDGEHKQCNGDSGGPLTKNGIQYGVVSWSFKPCKSTNAPGTFTDVANYRLWIRRHSGM